MPKNTKNKPDWILAGRRSWYTRFKRQGLSDWHATEAAGLLKYKIAERKEIAQFLLENHPEDSPWVSLTLSGSRFEMEKRIARLRKDASFVCLERDAHFIDVAFGVFSKHAPGGKLKPEGTASYRNRRTRLLNIEAGEFGQVELDAPITAVWYDGMGLMNARDFRLFLESLEQQITTEHPVPAVFTLMLGRDDAKFYEGLPGHVTAKRARKLVSLLKRAGLNFDLRKFWDYRSDSGGSMRMLNICGLLTRKVAGQGRSNSWGIVQPDELASLRHQMTAHGLAALLGMTVHTVRLWGEDKAPDVVAQAQLEMVIRACQGMDSRT